MNLKPRGKQANKVREQENIRSIGSPARSSARSALLVVICAAQVIAALGTHQLAMMSRKPVAAGRTDLAMVIDVGIGSTRRLT